MTFPGFTEPEPIGSGEDREYLNPRDVIGHLMMIYVVQYVPDAPTKKNPNGDAVIVDVVDLYPGQGRLYRLEWWRPGYLVGALKKKVGNVQPIMGVMREKEVSRGTTFEIESMTQNPKCVQMAQQWYTQNPGFAPSPPQVLEKAAPERKDVPAPPTFDPWAGMQQVAPPDPFGHVIPMQQAPVQQAPVQQAPPPPDPAVQAGILERLRQQQQHPQGFGGQLPPAPPQPDEPPF